MSNYRRCKYCSKKAKLNIRPDGRNKGYYRTCGSEQCLKMQYKDPIVNRKKGSGTYILVNCLLCDSQFKGREGRFKYCSRCCPDKKWKSRARRYGINKNHWEYILSIQDNKCYLCENEPTDLDHCHVTGQIRGLLCSSCNLKLGTIENNLQWTLDSIDYLRKDHAPICFKKPAKSLVC